MKTEATYKAIENNQNKFKFKSTHAREMNGHIIEHPATADDSRAIT